MLTLVFAIKSKLTLFYNILRSSIKIFVFSPDILCCVTSPYNFLRSTVQEREKDSLRDWMH